MKNFSPFLAPAPRDRCASSLTPPRGTLIRFPVAVQCERMPDGDPDDASEAGYRAWHVKRRGRHIAQVCSSSPQHRRSVGCRSLAGTRRTPRRHPRWRSSRSSSRSHRRRSWHPRRTNRVSNSSRASRTPLSCACVPSTTGPCPRRDGPASLRAARCVFSFSVARSLSNAVVRARRGAPRWGAGGGHEFPVVVAGRAVGPCLRRSVGAHPEAREQADVRRDMHFTLDPRNAWEGPLPSRSRDAKEHCEEARAGGRARHQATD